jgi:hypothetical protein
MTDNAELLTRINTAVAAVNEAEQGAETAKAELVSRSKAVGVLLLEAKKLHPKVTDFEAFLKRVNGLKLSRAYDLLRLAGGRTTDEELRKDARERKQKSRAKKKIPVPPKSIPTPEPIFVTKPHVTESQEIDVERRRAEMAALDSSAERGNKTADISPAAQSSAKALAEFLVACRTWLPKITADADRLSRIIDEWTSSKAEAA